MLSWSASGVIKYFQEVTWGRSKVFQGDPEDLKAFPGAFHGRFRKHQEVLDGFLVLRKVRRMLSGYNVYGI